MHNSAVDDEFELRKKLIDENVVDVIILTSPNLFYTVNLPSTLWFLDKKRPNSKRKDYILFIDASRMFKYVDTVHREITDDQINSIACIVRNYREDSEYGNYIDEIGFCKRVHISEVKKKWLLA